MEEGVNAADASAQALARGDFDALADAFANAGLTVRLPARGMLQVSVARPRGARLLLSVGVHGDETAPIALLAGLLAELAAAPRALARDLLIVVGNPEAIGAGQRYVEADLNRMFRDDRGDLAGAIEAGRADTIMRAAQAFFAGTGGPGWQLDLHSAIRASRYPTFAVVPELIPPGRRLPLLAWLAQAEIDAAILNPTSAGTFSAWSAARGATAATLELGRVAALGAGEPARFAAVAAALRALLRGELLATNGPRPVLFRVAQELRKHSAAFRPHFGPETENFAPFAPGSLIAEDGDIVYRTGSETEYVVFPNPDVRPGLRAGLMLVRG
jgi:succinylglutamate desuccinylase